MPSLKDFAVLTFDVYGTLIDWETGIMTALQPLFVANNYSTTKEALLPVLSELEAKQQAATPDLPYSDLLAAIHPQLATRLGLTHLPTPAESRAFGASVGIWPAFPDTVDALRRLRQHYKLVVLSNVDRESFAATRAGPLQNAHFDLVLTAQDIGSYKPDPRNFAYMLDSVRREFGDGFGREKVLQTAQSQFHDHYPARDAGIRSCWIAREGAVMGNREEVVFDWRFGTLGEMADAVEEEAKSR
ncbi:haloacid dehalogenase [Magnaporthiopsis poae ATCC 64411]|uniref:Haloacid dehalogenase n=1 Tax=Magnaporthiopsis poae (strain ATCC 64411 / 73-15) TaxID=644358 RepID=A0A0C4EF97_MAGP6|nr:haloacid dehalogenase [Magnaporthiopsis poae ATCC 64411]